MSPPLKSSVLAASRGLVSVFSKRTFQSSAYALSEEGSKFKFMDTPSPPKLPEKEQKEWEELIKRATQSSSTIESELANQAAVNATQPQTQSKPTEQTSLHPDLRRGSPPEFEGDVNPKTGEVGGPKNEPLRWGPKGDYSFNGRVTDF